MKFRAWGSGQVRGSARRLIMRIPFLTPAGLDQAVVRPAAAKWNPQLSEFLLMYDDVRNAISPEDALYSSWKARMRRERASGSGIARRWR